MELVTDYLFHRYIGKRDPLPFPQYLFPENRYKNDFWITQQGECVYPWEMTNRHLIYTVRMIHRRYPEYLNMYKDCQADEWILYGKSPLLKKKKKNGRMLTYSILWEELRLYMLLRREIKLRELEEYIQVDESMDP